MEKDNRASKYQLNRRQFGLALGMAGSVRSASAGTGPALPARPATPVHVRVAFAYPPTKNLREQGYYSWPGSGFDAEGRQAHYSRRLEEFARQLNLRLEIEREPLDLTTQVEAFLASTRLARPAGLLLIPFKKSHFDHVMRIVEEAALPSIIFATMGILLNAQIQKVQRRPGVYLINSLDNLEAVRLGLKMIAAAQRMRQSKIVNINGSRRSETTVPHLGTTVLTVPHAEFYDRFARIGLSEQVQKLARTYLKDALKCVEPSLDDVQQAAKTYFVLKQIVEQESADALMMNCLPGLAHPRKHVPPCMGFMNLHDEGIPAGCESDLDATLTMMLIQFLFDKPAFQHNPSMDTEKNRYFGAHCTAPLRMNGPAGKAERYILRSHAEAGFGCVPQVLFPTGQKVTFAKYLSGGDRPRMLIYGGTITDCPSNPPCGGCRTNVEISVDELKEATEVKGHHLCMFYGQHAGHLRTFCQLLSIEPVA